MKLWRWFVGQVSRLRRSVAGVLAAGRQPLHADDQLASDEAAPGPPAHWVERVRRGAPGLLEPSLRRRGGPPEPAPANRVARSQTELEPEREPLERPGHDLVRPEPPDEPRRPEAPVRTPRARKAAAQLFRNALRRVSASALDASNPTAPNASQEREPSSLVHGPAASPVAEPEAPHELYAPTRRVEHSRPGGRTARRGQVQR